METTNDATRATAEAMPEISRRRFLLNATMAGAAVAVAAPVAAAEPEVHPLARLHELHEEASALMAVQNEHFGGEWELRIRAPHDRCPVIYKSLDAEREMTPREQAIWHMRELERLMRLDGAEKIHVAVIATYGPGDLRGLAIQDSGKLHDPDNMFARKGGAA